MFDAIYSSFLDDGDRFLTKDDWRHLFSPSKATDGCCGYALLDKDRIVGILGMLFSYRTVRGVERRFCNLHSWYVLPAYRGKSLTLMRPALRLRDCTLTDLTPTDAVCEINQRLGCDCSHARFQPDNIGNFKIMRLHRRPKLSGDTIVADNRISMHRTYR